MAVLDALVLAKSGRIPAGMWSIFARTRAQELDADRRQEPFILGSVFAEDLRELVPVVGGRHFLDLLDGRRAFVLGGLGETIAPVLVDR